MIEYKINIYGIICLIAWIIAISVMSAKIAAHNARIETCKSIGNVLTEDYRCLTLDEYQSELDMAMGTKPEINITETIRRLSHG